jgi:hypothetical protein
MIIHPPPCIWPSWHNTLGLGLPSGAYAEGFLMENGWTPPNEWGMWNENLQT